MKKLILAFGLMMAACTLQAKTALMVISHGAPGKAWNANVLNVEKRLQTIEITGISYKRVALMEYSTPDIKAVVDDCEAQGCDTILALPLFIAPSSHSSADIPNILDLQYNPEVRAGLAEEKTRMVHSKAHIVEGPELYFGDVIDRSTMMQVSRMSKDPKNEALVLLAHGDPDRVGFWNELLERNCKAIADSLGIDYTDSKLIAMGQHFADDLKPVLTRAAKAKKRVLVQGLYLTTSIAELAEAFGLDQQTKELTGSDTAEVVYGKGGILPDSEQEVVDWIVATATAWHNNR